MLFTSRYYRKECVTQKLNVVTVTVCTFGSQPVMHSRGTEHTAAIHNKDKDSVLLRHLQDKYSRDDDSTPIFKMSVIDTQKKLPYKP